jgi:hypothetical protein
MLGLSSKGEMLRIKWKRVCSLTPAELPPINAINGKITDVNEASNKSHWELNGKLCQAFSPNYFHRPELAQ